MVVFTAAVHIASTNVSGSISVSAAGALQPRRRVHGGEMVGRDANRAGYDSLRRKQRFDRSALTPAHHQEYSWRPGR